MTFGRESVFLQTTPSMFGIVWCMLGGSHVEVWTKNILYWFIEVKLILGMPRGATNEFGPLFTKIDCSLFKVQHYL